MPWWAYLYLSIVAVSIIIGIEEKKTRKYGLMYIAGDALSFLLICICVIGYFKKVVPELLGSWLLAIVVTGIVLEFLMAIKTLECAPHLPDISRIEKEIISGFYVVVVGIIVLIGYVLGFMAWLNV